MRCPSLEIFAVLLVATCSVMSGCSPLGPRSDPTRFYVLSLALSDQERASQRMEGVVVGVGPFELSPYLDRPQIVTRVASNEVTVSGIDRWAEPLDEGIRLMAIQNLLMMLEPSEIVSHPWTSANAPDYSIVFSIDRFERNSDGNADLFAIWALRSPKTGGRGALRESAIVEPVEGESTEALVEGLSRALTRLSVEFADAIREANAQSPPAP